LGTVEGEHILAYKLSGRFLTGDVQPQNYTYYGRTGPSVQRGYEMGSYIDKNMLDFEIEYRLQTP